MGAQTLFSQIPDHLWVFVYLVSCAKLSYSSEKAEERVKTVTLFPKNNKKDIEKLPSPFWGPYPSFLQDMAQEQSLPMPRVHAVSIAAVLDTWQYLSYFWYSIDVFSGFPIRFIIDSLLFSARLSN